MMLKIEIKMGPFGISACLMVMDYYNDGKYFFDQNKKLIEINDRKNIPN